MGKAKTEDGKHECPEKDCSLRFRRANDLQRHIRTHTNERPYKCAECDSAFRQSYQLTIHIRRHTGEKPFTCPVCQRKFADGSSWKRHEKAKICKPSTSHPLDPDAPPNLDPSLVNADPNAPPLAGPGPSAAAIAALQDDTPIDLETNPPRKMSSTLPAPPKRHVKAAAGKAKGKNAKAAVADAGGDKRIWKGKGPGKKGAGRKKAPARGKRAQAGKVVEGEKKDGKEGEEGPAGEGVNGTVTADGEGDMDGEGDIDGEGEEERMSEEDDDYDEDVEMDIQVPQIGAGGAGAPAGAGTGGAKKTVQEEEETAMSAKSKAILEESLERSKRIMGSRNNRRGKK